MHNSNIFFTFYYYCYQREQEGEIDRRDQPVCSGSRVAAVVAVDVARPLSAEAVEQTEDVADENQQHQTRHAQTDVVTGKKEWKLIVNLVLLGQLPVLKMTLHTGIHCIEGYKTYNNGKT